ncbi:bifunctional phosphopantothenoylcysteine decarboxylase/phosphopantothenate--cysteine ligase CoaBC [bacterium]|nr:bifunctional phosphopantothenoylcysteine decarboxylase/phosphopantothenate--cysteine ligase CoaBC [bacterium]
MLKDRRVLLGVSGGIAAYKAAEITRSLIRENCQVTVVMTRNACRFITPLTFQALTGRPVATELFSGTEAPVPHISLAKWPDLILLVPATADLLARTASGRANDLLAALILAAEVPVLWAPAMNTHMWKNPLTQENIKRLVAAGHAFVQPGTGELACGDIGEGRLADNGEILDAVRKVLITKGKLSGYRILITAGPTREPWDAIRFLSNRSSGRMGYALAMEAGRRGAEVSLVSGPVNLAAPSGVRIVNVNTAREMYDVVMPEFPETDIVIAAAAVADFRPAEICQGKLKKYPAQSAIPLEQNPDILMEMGRRKQKQILVGFAAETHNLVPAGIAKRKAKNLDLIIVNHASGPEDAFGAEAARVLLIDDSDAVRELPRQDKHQTAAIILDQLEELLSAKQAKQ